MPVSLEELNIPDPIEGAFKAHGITAEYLTKKLKKELNAKNITRSKVRGAISQDNVSRGVKVIGTSGVVHENEKEGLIYGDGETVLEFKDADMAIRQKARMDAHKLRGDYPSEKHEISGKNGKPIEFKDVKDREDLRAKGQELLERIKADE